MKILSDSQLEQERLLGEISLYLEHGTFEERQSLGKLLKMYNPNFETVLESYGIILQ